MSIVVSIIIPHHNRAELLRETIASVEAQEYREWEVIIIDDHSDAEQCEAVEEYNSIPGVRVIRNNDQRRGPSAARNLGISVASGDYLIFLDSDDLLAPWCLGSRVTAISAKPDTDFVVFPVLLFGSQPGDRRDLWNALNTDERDLHRFLRSDPPWCVTSPIWRASAITALGGFNEAVMYGDDADLHMRALMAGMSYQTMPDEVVDAFIRRDETPRITNSDSDAMLESRRQRLREGSTALQMAGAELRVIWEGQYFVEAEYILFNVKRPNEPLNELFAVWDEIQPPTFLRRFVVRFYFALCMATRDCCYLIVRIARRVMQTMLPHQYFPPASEFHSATLNDEGFDEFRKRLGYEHDATTKAKLENPPHGFPKESSPDSAAR